MNQTIASNDNAVPNQKRRFPRRNSDICMVNVDGHPYPVVDWSQCGVLFEADTKPFIEGQPINMILRFKTSEGIEDVKITGEVVRKNSVSVAASFDDVAEATLQSFEKVIQKATG